MEVIVEIAIKASEHDERAADVLYRVPPARLWPGLCYLDLPPLFSYRVKLVEIAYILLVSST